MCRLPHKQPRMKPCLGQRLFAARGDKRVDCPKYRPHKTAHCHRHAQRDQASKAMVLLNIEIKAIEEVPVDQRAIVGAARAAEMPNARLRHKDYLPARVVDPSLPVSFFAIHEEAFIESAHLLIDFP